MARSFDGTNDNLSSADNAVPGLDANLRSWGLWFSTPDDVDTQYQVAGITASGGSAPWAILLVGAGASSGLASLVLGHQFSTTSGTWVVITGITTGTPHHIAITYDRGSTANDPVMYIDGVSQSVSEDSTPAGTATTGDDTLRLGENAVGGNDFDGLMSHLVIETGALWDAAAVNRARWWGRPHGGLLVYHPLWGEKLADEGSAAETLTATGSVVTTLVTPVVRPGAAMMGMGVGW